MTAVGPCPDCGVERTQATTYSRHRKDGSVYLYPRCKKCTYKKFGDTDSRRAYSAEWKRRKRRAAGMHERGKKPVCVNGHPRNGKRHGKYSCYECHKDQEERRRRRAGAQKRVPRTHCRHGHELTPDNVGSKGRCLTCHRLREAALPAKSREYASILSLDPCSYCGSSDSTIEIDHIVPKALGGGNEWDNLTAACQSCNRRKHAIPLLTYLVRTAA